MVGLGRKLAAMMTRRGLTVISSNDGSVLWWTNVPVTGVRPRRRGVSGAGVPQHGQAQADQPERHGRLHGNAGAVAGLADTQDLTGIGERDLDPPPSRVAGHKVFDRRWQVGGDQR